MKKFIKILSFILLFIILFLGGQEVLTPDWDQGEHVDCIIGGMEYLDDETVDVIFLGTSHMEYGVSPVLLYKNEGICSYNLSTSAQPIELSYYLLKQSLKSQHPQAIVMDVGALFRQTDYDYNFAWRYVFDCVVICLFSNHKVSHAMEQFE